MFEDLTEIVNDQPNVSIVTWSLSSMCNYDCWYCPPSLHDNRNKFKDPDRCLEFFNEYCQSKERVVLSMLGGEPTLWSGIKYFLNNLPLNVSVEISSNGSRTLKWWKTNHPRIDSFILSYHPRSADDDHFYSVVELLEAENKHVEVAVIYDNTNLEFKSKSERFFDRLEKSNLKINAEMHLLRFNAGSKIMDYTEVELENKKRSITRSKHRSVKPSMFLYNGSYVDVGKLKLSDKNQFAGWMCSAGVNSIYINQTGDIYRANCGIGERIGNIETDHSFLDQDLGYVKCNKTTCGCGDDIVLHKKMIKPLPRF